jgi:hypothetical protein
MKKIHSILLTAATTIGLLTACSDVPMPYDINFGRSSSFGKVMPYKNASLGTFTTYDLRPGYAAWSQGSSYTQATGYQAWAGASQKSYKEVESYLISPPLNTNCESGKVRLSFDHTLRYTDRVSGWQNYHKIYISKNYDGNSRNFERATWHLINYTPEASTYSDWTLYSSGYIQVPEEFVNHDSIYIAFYFYAPAANSTTWELENFLIEEGVADNSGEGGETTETVGTKESPLSVTEAMGKVGKKGYVTGYIVGYVDGTKLQNDEDPNQGAKFGPAPDSETEVLLADSPDETEVANVFPVQLPAGEIRTALNPSQASVIGKKVTLYGSLDTYFGVPGMKNTSWAEMDGKTYGTDPDAEKVPLGDPKGDGSQANPFNVAAAITFTSALQADKNSDAKYIEGIICNDPSIDTGQYGNATFYISDDGTDANKFYIFRIFDFGNQHFTDAQKIKRGDKVVIYSPLVNYRGNTPETSASKGYLISINDESGGGGNTPTPPTPTGNFTRTAEVDAAGMATLTIVNNDVTEMSANPIFYDFKDLQLADKTKLTETYTIGDNLTISFDGGTNTKSEPTYYTNNTATDVRIYANNNIYITASQPIQKIVMTCSSIASGPCTGNETMTFQTEDEGRRLTICNASSSAGTQLRIQTISVYYGK